MMNKIVDFFAYNNAVPIAFGILFLGAAGAAAATPEVRDVVLSSETQVQSIDNSRIVNVDIETYSFAIQITDVQEDDEQYYVTYTLQTIDLVDSVWQDILQERELVVSKAALDGKDLGLYATSEIAEVRDSEKRRLTETQVYEKEIGASQKVVATVYSGLVGQFLSPTEDTLPNYEPVIPEPEPIVAVETTDSEEGGEVLGAATSTDTIPPSISLIGESVVRHPKGQPYVDLGVVVTDNVDTDIAYDIFVDNNQVEVVDIDTSRLWAYVITYRVTDSGGNTSEARREVVVEEIQTTPPPAPEPDPVTPATTTPETSATTTPETASSTPEAITDPEPQATTTEETASSTPVE